MTETNEIEIDISGEGVWDDSELIKKWDSIVDEYKKYHNRDAEMEISTKRQKKTDEEDEEMVEFQQKESIESIELQPNEKDIESIEQSDDISPVDETVRPDLNHSISTNKPDLDPSSLENAISLQGLDSNTRNLVMAWYWAGYYHGLSVGKNTKVK